MTMEEVNYYSWLTLLSDLTFLKLTIVTLLFKFAFKRYANVLSNPLIILSKCKYYADTMVSITLLNFINHCCV